MKTTYYLRAVFIVPLFVPPAYFPLLPAGWNFVPFPHTLPYYNQMNCTSII